MKRKHVRIIAHSNPLGAIGNTARGLFEAHLVGELLDGHSGGPHNSPARRSRIESKPHAALPARWSELCRNLVLDM